MARPRLLLAITVYNGREVVFSCLRSATELAHETVDVDILVLDDASPEPGLSENVRAACQDLGIAYYRTPRNLGIPRNVNLALLWSIEREYDYVIISNSDVLFCQNLPDLMVRIAHTDPSIGSVTAWSNNVSIYSLPNNEPDVNLSEQDRVNWVAESLWGNFGTAAVDVPVGISFCILIPTPVLRRVGLMDPVFGRGYCEETDWTLRSKCLGYRITLAPSCFVYHHGQASNVDAGLVAAGHHTVPDNEDLIDLRYPFFRGQVSAFLNSDLLPTLHKDAIAKLTKDAAREWGYSIEFGQLPRHQYPVASSPIVDIESQDGELIAVSRFLGFRYQIPIKSSDDLLPAVLAFFESDPRFIHIGEPVIEAERMAATLKGLDLSFEHKVAYPTKI
jgi:GT2 family glycosyltransferase